MPDTLSTPESETPSTNAGSPTSPEPGQAEPTDRVATDAPAIGDTAGTGTIIALGCIGATVFLIVIGLLYLLITQLFG